MRGLNPGTPGTPRSQERAALRLFPQDCMYSLVVKFRFDVKTNIGLLMFVGLDDGKGSSW